MNDGDRSSIEAAPSVRSRVCSLRSHERGPNNRPRLILMGNRVEPPPTGNDGEPALGGRPEYLADRRRSSVDVANPLHRVRVPLPILVDDVDGITRSERRQIPEDGESVLPVNMAADDHISDLAGS